MRRTLAILSLALLAGCATRPPVDPVTPAERAAALVETARTAVEEHPTPATRAALEQSTALHDDLRRLEELHRFWLELWGLR